MRLPWHRWVFLFVVIIGFYSATAGKRGGVRKRLLESESDVEAAAAPPNPSSSSKAGRGIRGRVNDDAPVPKGKPKAKGPLVDELVSMWSKGQLKTAAVQRLAMKAEQQGTPDIATLGAIGNSGRNPQNMFRAMRNLLGWPQDTAPISWIELPTVKGRTTPWPVLWPHHFLQHLSEDNFNRRLRGPEHAALNF